MCLDIDHEGACEGRYLSAKCSKCFKCGGPVVGLPVLVGEMTDDAHEPHWVDIWKTRAVEPRPRRDRS
jgi:hypothetical protein